MAGPDDVAFNGEKRVIGSAEDGVLHRSLPRLMVLGPGMHAYIKSEIHHFGYCEISLVKL